MKKLLPLAILFAAACATTPPTATPAAPPPPATGAAAQPCNPGLALADATAWFQSSAEYRANALQTYATARRNLDAAIADPSWKALTTAPAGAAPAIILDLDETAIDNGRFEARMVLSGKGWDQQSWNRWVAEEAATAIPGAADFLAYAKSRGVKIFYVTNRRQTEEAATRANLEKLGFPLEAGEDTLLSRAERPEWDTDDKTPRRDYVASKYRVVMLFGDDLNDFTRAFDKSLEERNRIISDNAAMWGSRWFILPNAIYGSWQRALTGKATGCDQMEKIIDALAP